MTKKTLLICSALALTPLWGAAAKPQSFDLPTDQPVIEIRSDRSLIDSVSTSFDLSMLTQSVATDSLERTLGTPLGDTLPIAIGPLAGFSIVKQTAPGAMEKSDMPSAEALLAPSPESSHTKAKEKYPKS